MSARATAEPTGLRWLAPVLGVATFVALMWGFGGFRGASAEGLAFAEAASQVARWMQGSGTLREAWSGPWPPLTLGTVGALIAAGMGPLRAAHLVSALSISLAVPLVWGLGRRAGGPPGAIGAVAVFVLTPRIIGLGTTAGPGASAICGIAFAVYALYRARRSRAWTVAAPFALALAALNSQVGLLLIPVWIGLTLTDKGLATGLIRERGSDPEAPAGHLRSASFPARLLAVPIVAVVLVAFGSPLAVGGVGAWLETFYIDWVQQPHDAFVYADAHITSGRVPWHAGPVLVIATLPPVSAVLAAAGIFGEMLLRWVRASPLARFVPRGELSPDPEAAGPEAREAKRWAFSALVAMLVAPVLIGTPNHGGTDLIALAIPFVAVFAGCTISRLGTRAARAMESRDIPIPRRVPLAGAVAALGTFFFVPAAIDCARSMPATEAYYNGLMGGTEGAVQKGFGRNPSRVAPVIVGRAASEIGGSVGFVVDEPLWRKAMAAYDKEGFLTSPTIKGATQASVVVLTHADEDPEYFRVAPAFAATARDGGSLVLRGGGLRLFTIARINPP